MGIFGIKSKKEKTEEELNRQVAEANEFIKKINTEKSLPSIPTQLLLKSGEEAFIQTESALYESRATSYYQGSSSGGGFRVMKGVYVGGSSRSGKSESKQELKVIDKGTLVMTNKRLVFSGLHENRNILLDKILSLEPKSDSILVTAENKTKKMYFTVPNGIIWSFTFLILKNAPDPHKLIDPNLTINLK
ncbi:MAG: hypothetical protein WBE27_01915 [Microgenomates group bacterium]